MADRYTYLPGLGILLAAHLGRPGGPPAISEARRPGARWERPATAAVLGLAFTTRAGVPSWKDSETLFTRRGRPPGDQRPRFQRPRDDRRRPGSVRAGRVLLPGVDCRGPVLRRSLARTWRPCCSSRGASRRVGRGPRGGPPRSLRTRGPTTSSESVTRCRDACRRPPPPTRRPCGGCPSTGSPAAGSPRFAPRMGSPAPGAREGTSVNPARIRPIDSSPSSPRATTSPAIRSRSGAAAPAGWRSPGPARPRRRWGATTRTPTTATRGRSASWARWRGCSGPSTDRARAGSRRRSGGRPGRVLDVGCGRGFLLDAFRRRGWTVEGTEMSDASSAHAREVLRSRFTLARSRAWSSRRSRSTP